MTVPAVKFGVVLGMVATVVSFFPILKLLMGHCFFEQGCGKYENLQLIGVAFASCLIGFIAAWVGVLAIRAWVRREQ